MRSFPTVAALGLLAAACHSPQGDDASASGAEAPRPVAVAGHDVALVLTPDELGVLAGEIVGDGSRSFMPGRPGADLTYRWRVVLTAGGAQIDDPSSPTPKFSLAAEGVHVFSLVVTYQGVDALPDRFTITAELGQRRNAPPVADFTVAPERPIVGLQITLDASLSHDEDAGDVVAGYLWEVTPPAPGLRLDLGTEAIATFTPEFEGEHEVLLVVTDNRGARTRLERGVFVASCKPVGDEICNGEDEDCDGTVDEGLSTDEDGDGHYLAGSCRRPADDCDDTDGLRFPGGVEICDNKDNDCDDEADEGLDTDGDGVTPCAGDCDDTDGDRFPGAPEVCDRVDQDCDDEVDEGFDSDGDGYTRCAEPLADCDDSQASINPTAVERCDGIDNNCDGEEGFDVDGDSFTNCQEDCDDDPNRNPGVPEIPGNGIDEDCDGHDALAACRDQDADGYCAFGISCDRVAAGCDLEQWDCNDSVATARPGLAEVCDLRDNDCDGGIDEGFDLDEDGAKTCQGDCDDTRADVCPFCPELCDGIDNNCNHLSDETLDDCEAPCEGPGVESCNGADDDCDGEIDEDVGHGDPCNRPICPGGTPGTWWCGERVPGNGAPELLCTPGVIVATPRDVACLDFSRPTPATYVADAAGTIAHAAADEPRFEYVASTGRAHLLVEGPRTNLAFDTSTPDVPDWTVYTERGEDGSLESHAAGAPDTGPYTEVHALAHGSGTRQRQFEAVQAGESLVYSMWARSASLGRIALNEPRRFWRTTAAWKREYGIGPALNDSVDFLVLRLDDGDPATDFNLWGMQIEQAKFASSYIPRHEIGDTGERPADLLTVPAGALDTTHGTWIAWFSPRFTVGTVEEAPTLFASQGAVTVDLDLSAAGAWRCATAGRSVILAANFDAGDWIFIACRWGADTGLKLWRGRGENLEAEADPTNFDAAADPDAPLTPVPEWSHLGEARLYQRALSDAEVERIYSDTGIEYP